MIIQPRHTIVTVGPPGAIGRSWNQELYIKGSVERTAAGTPNKAKIELYNLNSVSLAYLEKPGQVLHVQVGAPQPSTIFYGELRKRGIKTSIKHPNQVTTLEATDGQRIMQEGYFSGSYPAGTTVTQIRTDALAANAVALGYACPLPERVYQGAVAFADTLPNVLDELYAGQPVSWSIQGGRFELLHDDLPRPGNALVISAQTCMIGSPERTDKGVKVKISQLGVARPGQPIAIQSRLVSGTYRVTKAVANWDTELQWEDDLIATVIK